MTVNLLGLLLIVVSGWIIGRARPVLNLPVFILTLFAAVTGHSAMQWAFLEGRMDVVFGDPRSDGAVAAVVPIAAAEAVGLWLPFLILPWTAIAARAAAALYGLTASVLAALYHYFPYDLVVIGPELIASDGPPYLFAWVACLPPAAIGFALGWLQSRRELADRYLDEIEMPGD